MQRGGGWLDQKGYSIEDATHYGEQEIKRFDESGVRDLWGAIFENNRGGDTIKFGGFGLK